MISRETAFHDFIFLSVSHRRLSKQMRIVSGRRVGRSTTFPNGSRRSGDAEQGWPQSALYPKTRHRRSTRLLAGSNKATCVNVTDRTMLRRRCLRASRCRAIKQRVSDPKQFTIVDETSANWGYPARKNRRNFGKRSIPALAQSNSVITSIESAKTLLDKQNRPCNNSCQQALTSPLQQLHRKLTSVPRPVGPGARRSKGSEIEQSNHQEKMNGPAVGDSKKLSRPSSAETGEVSELRDSVATDSNGDRSEGSIRVLRNATT